MRLRTAQQSKRERCRECASCGCSEIRAAYFIQHVGNCIGIPAFQEINVYAKVSGYIQKLNVDWGTHVKQGQLLAVLEIPELQQQLQQDEAAVRRSEQDLARANEELSRAESAYNVAHLTYTRLADVQKTRPELVAQQEMDVAEGKDLEASAGVSARKRCALPPPSRHCSAPRPRSKKTKRCMRMRASRRLSTEW